jgi:pyruvate carboxylase subunit B
VPVEIERRGDGIPVKVYLKGVPYDVEISKMASTRFRPPMPEREISGEVRSTLPGQVIRMYVKPGDTVSEGDPLFILDAMKMENEIHSPKAGTIQSIAVEDGQIVAKGDLILEIAG